MIVGGCGLDLGEGDGLGVVLVCFGLLEFSGFFLLLLFVYFFAEAEFFFEVVAHEEFGEGFGAVGLFAELEFGCDEAVGGSSTMSEWMVERMSTGLALGSGLGRLWLAVCKA